MKMILAIQKAAKLSESSGQTWLILRKIGPLGEYQLIRSQDYVRGDDTTELCGKCMNGELAQWVAPQNPRLAA